MQAGTHGASSVMASIDDLDGIPVEPLTPYHMVDGHHHVSSLSIVTIANPTINYGDPSKGAFTDSRPHCAYTLHQSQLKRGHPDLCCKGLSPSASHNSHVRIALGRGGPPACHQIGHTVHAIIWGHTNRQRMGTFYYPSDGPTLTIRILAHANSHPRRSF